MISSHALSAFLLNHPLNGLGNSNLRSVQEVIRASKPVTEKFMDICTDFPNLALLTKSSTPGEIQITFGHSTVRNKALGEILQAFSLAGDLALTSRSPLLLKERKFASRSRRAFFAPPPATSKEQKATGLTVPQRRPPSALPDRGRHSPWRIKRRITPEDLRSGNHQVGLRHGPNQQGRQG